MPRSSRTLICRAVVAGIVSALTLAGCGAGTHSPPQQQERERKAAGLAHFVIVCPPDLWDRTGGPHPDWRGDAKSVDPIPAKITKRPDGLVNVDLSGPHLIDLLELLDEHAHPGWMGDFDPYPLAVRLYDALAPEVDKVGTAPGGTTPQVVINDAVPKVSQSPTSSASTPKN